MSMVRQHGGWVIVLTLVVGLMLAIVPLPEWAQGLRPEWPLLVLVYWCLALPQRVGVGVSWLVGLCMDVLSGALLTEIVFSYPGQGYLLVRAVAALDYPLIQGLYLTITLAVLGANLLVDTVAVFVDPRLGSAE